MQELLRFRKGIESLNNEEYQRCIISIDRELVISLLFTALLHELTNNTNNIKTINQIISKISISRHIKSIANDQEEDDNNNNDTEESEDKSLELQDLASVNIQQITSYLRFEEKLNFEKCNTSIFIASRSSIIPMHALNDECFTKLLSYCNDNDFMPKHSPFNSLDIDCDDIMRFNSDDNVHELLYKWKNFHFFRYIEELIIEYRFLSQIKELLKYLTASHIVLSKVKIFRINDYDHSSWLDEESMADIRSIIVDKLHNLQYFEITEYSEDFPAEPYDVLFDEEWVSKLKGLAVFDYNYNEERMAIICSAISDNLESFHKGYGPFTNAIDGKLNKLKELCVSWWSIASKLETESFRILLKQNLNNIKRIHFSEVVMDQEDICIESIQMIINKIIGNIQYIGFSMKKHENSIKSYGLTQIFDILINGLQNSQKYQLKIRINGFQDVHDMSDFIVKLEELIDCLNNHCSNWMLIFFDFKIVSNDKDMVLMKDLMKRLEVECMNKYCSIYIDDEPINWNDLSIIMRGYKLLDGFLKRATGKYCVNIQRTHSDKDVVYDFVVYNKGCNINGYHDRWIMKCEMCDQPNILN